MLYRRDAKSVFKQSAFFEPSDAVDSPKSDPKDLKKQAEQSNYVDTFEIFSGLESQILGLEAIFQDTYPETQARLQKLIKLSKLHQAESEGDDKKDFATQFEQAKADYQAHSKQSERANVLALMLFYYATVMQQHYERYSHKEKIKRYQKLSEQAEIFINTKLLIDTNLENIEQLAEASNQLKDQSARIQTHTIINAIKQDAKSVYVNFKEGLLRTSRWRDALSAINLQRIYWIFCHFVMSQLQAMAFTIEINLKLYGKDITWVLLDHIDEFCKKIDTPKNVLNVLSVALFGIRFVIDILMILKHASDYFCSDDEKTVKKGRAWAELEKRAFDMANNIVWGTANFITNYNHLCHIPDASALYIIAALLVFDALLLQARRIKAQRDFRRNRIALLEEWGHLDSLMQTLKTKEHELINRSDDDIEKIGLKKEKESVIEQLQLISLQIKALDDDWAVQNASYHYYTLAAVILCVSFSASLLMVVPPAGVLACYIVGVAATAMYLSGNLYSDYKAQKQKYLDAKQNYGKKTVSKEDLAQLKADYINARNAFRNSMIEKTVVPTLILIAFASNVAAGATVLGIYLVIKLSLFFLKKYKEINKKEAPSTNRYAMFNKFNETDSPKMDKTEKKRVSEAHKETSASDDERMGGFRAQTA